MASKVHTRGGGHVGFKLVHVGLDVGADGAAQAEAFAAQRVGGQPAPDLQVGRPLGQGAEEAGTVARDAFDVEGGGGGGQGGREGGAAVGRRRRGVRAARQWQRPAPGDGGSRCRQGAQGWARAGAHACGVRECETHTRRRDSGESVAQLNLKEKAETVSALPTRYTACNPSAPPPENSSPKRRPPHASPVATHGAAARLRRGRVAGNLPRSAARPAGRRGVVPGARQPAG